jgi:hypothetical protein
MGAQCKKSAQCREGIFNCAGKISKELKNNIYKKLYTAITINFKTNIKANVFVR